MESQGRLGNGLLLFHACPFFFFFLKCKGFYQETRNHPSYFKCRSFNPGSHLIQWKDKKWILR